MKLLTRDFSTREKVLLVILLVVIISAAYYLFVWTTVDDQITSIQSQNQSMETQLMIATAKVEKLQGMSAEMENDLIRSYMPSYNASKEELDFLHGTLAATEDYLINFTYLTRNGDQIKRGFSLQFTARSYAQAKEIIGALEDSEIRCLIGDYNINPTQKDYHLLEGKVKVVLEGCFYETMYDGVVDKELPKDSEQQ
nr:hypothetical protein [uncultured Butyrivibrio sp.]